MVKLLRRGAGDVPLFPVLVVVLVGGGDGPLAVVGRRLLGRAEGGRERRHLEGGGVGFIFGAVTSANRKKKWCFTLTSVC